MLESSSVLLSGLGIALCRVLPSFSISAITLIDIKGMDGEIDQVPNTHL